MSERQLAVVGGGISGLAAAWEATRRGWQVTVLEAADRTGGKIRTSPFSGRPVDEGADTFLRRVPDALELCAEIGLDDLTSPATGQASMWVGGALRPIPGGTVLGVPLDLDLLAAGGLVSAEAVAQVDAETDLTGEALDGDVALGPYLREHLGDEVVDHLVEPLVGGIYAGEIDQMSLDAATPQLAEAAHRSASLRRALASRVAPTDEGPVFAAPKGGMATLTDQLADAISAAGGSVRLRSPADSLARSGSGWVVSSSGHVDDLAVDAVVIALPPGPASRLLGPVLPEVATSVDSVATASVVLATLAYQLDGLPTELAGSGFLVPRTDPTVRITAASWFTSKWAQLARDDGIAILRVSMGHAGDPGAIDLDDAAIADVVARDLETTMGMTTAPVETRLSRWRDGFPQFAPGHLDRIAAIEGDLQAATPSLALAGAMMRGVGIPACIRQGHVAAQRVTG